MASRNDPNGNEDRGNQSPDPGNHPNSSAPQRRGGRGELQLPVPPWVQRSENPFEYAPPAPQQLPGRDPPVAWTGAQNLSQGPDPGPADRALYPRQPTRPPSPRQRPTPQQEELEDNYIRSLFAHLQEVYKGVEKEELHAPLLALMVAKQPLQWQERLLAQAPEPLRQQMQVPNQLWTRTLSLREARVRLRQQNDDLMAELGRMREMRQSMAHASVHLQADHRTELARLEVRTKTMEESCARAEKDLELAESQLQQQRDIQMRLARRAQLHWERHLRTQAELQKQAQSNADAQLQARFQQQEQFQQQTHRGGGRRGGR